MHTFREPILGVEFKWETRRKSVVTITGRLPLLRRWVPLKLKIQRSFLGVLFKEGPLRDNEPFDLALRHREVLEHQGGAEEWNQKGSEKFGAWPIRSYYFFRQIAHHLRDLSEKGPTHRKQSITLSVFPKKVATFTVPRQSLPLLKDFFGTHTHNDDPHVRILAMQLQCVFFYLAPATIRRILKPAKGRDYKKQLFAESLPAAYSACRLLVLETYNNRALDQRIQEVLNQLRVIDPGAMSFLSEADRCIDSYRDQVEIICLVYWAFYGAWERYGLNGLLEPQDVFRQYFYGSKKNPTMSLFKMTREEDPDTFEEVHEQMTKLYLGEPGAAAKAYHLL